MQHIKQTLNKQTLLYIPRDTEWSAHGEWDPFKVSESEKVSQT